MSPPPTKSTLSDVQIDPRKRLPDVYRLTNTSRIAYAVRPLIDFPHLDSYLLYPWMNRTSSTASRPIASRSGTKLRS